MIFLKAKSLFIQGFGLFVSKTSRRLAIRKKGRLLGEYPLVNLEEIIITGQGIVLSTDLLAILCAAAIPVIFLDNLGRPYALIFGPQTESQLALRRAQLKLSEPEALMLADALIKAKVRRQQKVLVIYGAASQKFSQWAARSYAFKNLDEAKGFEAQAAALYWRAIKEILPEDFKFPGRRNQDADDLLNKLLNYGYGVLYSKIWALLVRIGFDPFAGVIHSPERRQMAFLFDAVEPYRPLVDGAVLNYLLKIGQPRLLVRHRQLTLSIKREFIEKITAVLDEKVLAADRKRYRRADLMAIELRRLANRLERKSPEVIFEPNFL